jgi:superfamily II DNA/RNA helicase
VSATSCIVSAIGLFLQRGESDSLSCENVKSHYCTLYHSCTLRRGPFITGRNGRKGEVVAFVGRQDAKMAHSLRQATARDAELPGLANEKFRSSSFPSAAKPRGKGRQKQLQKQKKQWGQEGTKGRGKRERKTHGMRGLARLITPDSPLEKKAARAAKKKRNRFR